jgi:hypothetical protein
MPETVFAVDANIVDVTGYLDDLKEELLALKNESDKTLRKFMLSFETYGRYKSVAIVEKNAEDNKFQGVRGQFFSRYVLMLINAFRHLKL